MEQPMLFKILAALLFWVITAWVTINALEHHHQEKIMIAEQAIMEQEAFDEQLAQISDEDGYQPYSEFIYSDDGTVSIDLSTHQNKE